jgi:hypothetical protein
MGSHYALPEDFRGAMTMLQERRFPVHTAVTAIVALENAPRMLREWSASSELCKILVDLDDDETKYVVFWRYSHGWVAVVVSSGVWHGKCFQGRAI